MSMQCTDLHARAIGSDVTSEDSAVTFNIYDRAASDLGFLGMVQVKPSLIDGLTTDQWYKCVPLFAPALVLINLTLVLTNGPGPQSIAIQGRDCNRRREGADDLRS